MMMFLSVLLLAILQGLTEFLPVSSSGHLTVAQYFLGFQEPDLLLDVWLHLGTLLATLIAFRVQLLKLIRSLADRSAQEEHRLIGLLVAGSIPTALIGLLAKKQLEAAFASPIAVGVDLLITGAILGVAALASKRRKGPGRPLVVWIAVVIGIAQGIAILPGISRSGSTIAAALLLGIGAAQAAEFSFLLSLPAIAGALALQTKDLLGQPGQMDMSLLLFGSVVAGLVGYLALRWLLHLVARGRLMPFAVYCVVLGSSFLLWLSIAG